MNIIVDCVGDMCPIPVVKSQIQYRKLQMGDSLTVISDHSCTAQGITDAFQHTKCDLFVEDIDGIWEITIKKLI